MAACKLEHKCLGQQIWYSDFLRLLTIVFCFGLSAMTPVIADTIKVQDDLSTFATNYTIKMDSIGIGVTPESPRFWSINSILVYGVICNAGTCFPQPLPPNDFIVSGSAVSTSNSVNTTINLRHTQPGPLTIKIVDSGSSDLSPAVSIELKDCTSDTSVDDTNVNMAQLNESYVFGESVVVACTTSEVTNVTLTCNMNATWTQTGVCPSETTTVTVAPTTSTTKSDPETTTESPPTELPTTEPLITEGSPTNCTEEEICCECIAGIVIIIISAPPSGVFVVFIVFILYRGDFDFLKRDFKLCTGEFIGTSLAIVCAAILLSRCKSSEHWTGGDIACVVLGWIGAPVDVIFCIILIRKWFQKGKKEKRDVEMD